MKEIISGSEINYIKRRLSHKVRDDMEMYIRDHTEAEFSHGMCEECAGKAMKEFEEFKMRGSIP